MRQRLVILNSWDDEFSDYERYIDHSEFEVHYITAAEPRSPRLADFSGKTLVCEKPYDLDLLTWFLRDLTAELGPIDHLIALSEFDMLVAAELRERLNIAGMRPSGAQAVRDKVTMKSLVKAANLPAPCWLTATNLSEVEEFWQAVGKKPLIVKPRYGAASQGVKLVRSLTDLRQAWNEGSADSLEVEEFVDGPIYHIDGVVCSGELRFLYAGRYVGTCLGFANGQPLGSVRITSGALLRRLEAFSTEVCAALGLDNSSFHLEVIHAKDDRLVFLELGARVGGGEIPFMLAQAWGLDLVQMAVDCQLGRRPTQVYLPPHESSGFVMVPPPIAMPCELVSISYHDAYPSLVKGMLASTGTIYRETDYSDIPGRFLFHSQEKCVGPEIERFVKDCKVVAKGIGPADPSRQSA